MGTEYKNINTEYDKNMDTEFNNTNTESDMATKSNQSTKINIEELKPLKAHKPLMIFGRDVSQIPCFRDSMLYGIYSGIATGIATFMLTSRPKRALEFAMGSYMSIAMLYWWYCRYDFTMQKYAIRDVQNLLQQQNGFTGKTNIDDVEINEAGLEKTN